MKTTPIETKCPCSAPLHAKIGKPTQMEPKIAKLTCGKCGSRFLVIASKLPDRTFSMRFEEIEITAKAKEIFAAQSPA